MYGNKVVRLLCNIDINNANGKHTANPTAEPNNINTFITYDISTVAPHTNDS